MKDAEYTFAIEKKKLAAERARNARIKFDEDEYTRQTRIEAFWARQAAEYIKAKREKIILQFLLNCSIVAAFVMIVLVVRTYL